MKKNLKKSTTKKEVIILESKMNFDTNKELKELTEKYCDGCDQLKKTCLCDKGLKLSKLWG